MFGGKCPYTLIPYILKNTQKLKTIHKHTAKYVGDDIKIQQNTYEEVGDEEEGTKRYGTKR